MQLDPKEKENESSAHNEAESTPLKGFQLFLAETRLCWHKRGISDDTELKSMALTKWKAMSKEDKEFTNRLDCPCPATNEKEMRVRTVSNGWPNLLQNETISKIVFSNYLGLIFV